LFNSNAKTPAVKIIYVRSDIEPGRYRTGLPVDAGQIKPLRIKGYIISRGRKLSAASRPLFTSVEDFHRPLRSRRRERRESIFSFAAETPANENTQPLRGKVFQK
jgi:hypothetical protein